MSDQTLPHAAEAALPPANCSACLGGSEGWADTIDKAASMVYQYSNLRAMNAGRVQDRLIRELADLMMLRADLLTIRDTLRAQPNPKLTNAPSATPTNSENDKTK